MEDLPVYFQQRISPCPTGCWNWIGSIDRDGYGNATWNRRATSAHRAVYELVNGAIPVGLQIDHLCRNRACVNPQHLEAVTPQVNTARSKAATSCPKGHPYDSENTYWRPGKKYPQRDCKACRAQARLRYIDRSRNSQPRT